MNTTIKRAAACGALCPAFRSASRSSSHEKKLLCHHFPKHQPSGHARHGDFPPSSGHAGRTRHPAPRRQRRGRRHSYRRHADRGLSADVHAGRRQFLAHLQRRDRGTQRTERQRPRRLEGHHGLLRLQGPETHPLARPSCGQHRPRCRFRLGRGLPLQPLRPQNDHVMEGPFYLCRLLRRRGLSGEHLSRLLERRERQSQRQGIPGPAEIPGIRPRVHEGRQAARHGRPVPAAGPCRHVAYHCRKRCRRILQGQHSSEDRSRSGKERRTAHA